VKHRLRLATLSIVAALGLAASNAGAADPPAATSPSDIAVGAYAAVATDHLLASQTGLRGASPCFRAPAP